MTGGIGELRLPMLEWWRDEPLVVALPENCTGKTLTIAQSTDPVTLAFAAVVLLMALFLWQAFRGQFPLDALCGAFMAFFWMAGQLLPNARLGPAVRGWDVAVP